MSEKDRQIKQAREQIALWQVKVHDLEHRSKSAAADVRLFFNQQHGDIAAKLDEARSKADRLANCGEGAWDEAWAQWEEAAEDLATALETVSRRFV